MQSTSGTYNRVPRTYPLSPVVSTEVLIGSVNEVFAAEGEKGRRQSNNTLTPPYVTARPDVAYRRIQRPGEKLKFVVLATDGRTPLAYLYKDVHS